MGRGLSRQIQPEPPPTDAPPTQAPLRVPLGRALVTWLRNARTRRPHLRHVGSENTKEVPVALPSPSEPQGTRAEEPSLRTCIIQVMPAFEFLEREDPPLEASSLVVDRAIYETSESSFISERIPTPPQKELARELGSKEVGVPSELFLQEGAAQDLENESVDEPTQKTSKDPEEATLADIPSLEDEVWDPLPSSSSSLGHEEVEDLALKPRRWSSLDLEQVRPRVPPTRPGTTTEEASPNAFLRTQRGASCIDLPGGRCVVEMSGLQVGCSLATIKAQEHLHRLCQLLCSPSSAEAMPAVDYVARKHLKMATDHYLESNGRECGELMCAVLNSPYCSVEAALDLFLVKVKEGPWLAEEGKEQGSPTLDAATARATRAIGKIVRYIKDSSRLEAWSLELLLALVTNYIEVTRPGLEAPSRDRSSTYVPPEELAKIIIVLLKRVAWVSFKETSKEMLEQLSICPEGMALQLRSLLKSSSSLLQHLCSTWETEAPLEHSAGVVAFYIQMLHIGQRPHSPEKTWALLTAWLQHHSLAVQHQSRQGLLLVCTTYRETMSIQELLDGVLGGLQSPHIDVVLEFLGLAGQLGPLLHKEDQGPAKAHLAAGCRPLFHHEAAKIRKAALECFQHLLWRPEYQHQECQTIHDLLTVLVHVEDEDEEVAKTARETLRETAEVLRWHLEDSVLAGDTFSLQELLHKISKRLIQHCSSRREVEEQVYGCLPFFKSKLPSAKKAAAMLLGHVLHKASNICTESNTCTYEAWLSNLLADHDPEVRRVGWQTKAILARASALHSRHGLRAAFRRLVAGCGRERYPPEYAKGPPT